MKIKSQKDFWSGLMFIVAGIAFAVGALEYSFGSSARPGPGYFPFGLGILMAILGGIVLFTSLTVETADGDPFGKVAWKQVLVITGAIVLFGFALPRLGMVVTLPLLIIVVSMAGDEFHWGEVLLNAAILTAGSWVIFMWGLNLTIPLWPVYFTAT